MARDGQHLSDGLRQTAKTDGLPRAPDSSAEAAPAAPGLAKTKWGHASFWIACIPGLVVTLLAPLVVGLRSQYLVYPMGDDATVTTGVVALNVGATLVALAQILMSLPTLGQRDIVASIDLFVGVIAGCTPLVLEISGVIPQATDLWQILPGSCVLSPASYQHILTMGLGTFMSVGGAIKSQFDDVGGPFWSRVRRAAVPVTFAVSVWPALVTPFLVATWPAVLVGATMFAGLVCSSIGILYTIVRDELGDDLCSWRACPCSRPCGGSGANSRVAPDLAPPRTRGLAALETASPAAVNDPAEEPFDDTDTASVASVELSIAQLVERVTPFVVLLVVVLNTAAIMYAHSQSAGCPAAFAQPQAAFPDRAFPAGFEPGELGASSLFAVDVVNHVMLLTGGACLVLSAVLVVARAQESAAEARERLAALAADRLRQALRVLGHETRGPTNGAVLALSLLERSVRTKRLGDAAELLGDLRISLERTKRGLDALLALQSAEEGGAAADAPWQWGPAHASAARQVRAALRGACEAEGVALTVEVAEPHELGRDAGGGGAPADRKTTPGGKARRALRGAPTSLDQPQWEVFTDSDKIAAVCINFVSNALKHAPDRGGRVRLRVGLMVTDPDTDVLAAEYPDCGVPSAVRAADAERAGVDVSGGRAAGPGMRGPPTTPVLRQRPARVWGSRLRESVDRTKPPSDTFSGHSGDNARSGVASDSLAGLTKTDETARREMTTSVVGEAALVRAALAPARPAPQADVEASVLAREKATAARRSGLSGGVVIGQLSESGVRAGAASRATTAGIARGPHRGSDPPGATSRRGASGTTADELLSAEPDLGCAVAAPRPGPTPLAPPPASSGGAPDAPRRSSSALASPPPQPRSASIAARTDPASHPPPSRSASIAARSEPASRPPASRSASGAALSEPASRPPASRSASGAALSERAAPPPPSLSATAGPRPMVRCMLVVEALDNGQGMPEDVVRSGKLFVPFARLQQGDGSLRMASTGLGLSIVKSMAVRDLGGAVGVATKEGEGACFFAVVPCFGRRAAAGTAAASPGGGAWGGISAAGASVASAIGGLTTLEGVSDASAASPRDQHAAWAGRPPPSPQRSASGDPLRAAGTRESITPTSSAGKTRTSTRSRADREERRRQRAAARAARSPHARSASSGAVFFANPATSTLAGGSAGSAGRPLAFVVDDDTIGRQLMGRVLTSLGLACEQFSDGKPFLERLGALADAEEAAAAKVGAAGSATGGVAAAKAGAPAAAPSTVAATTAVACLTVTSLDAMGADSAAGALEATADAAGSPQGLASPDVGPASATVTPAVAPAAGTAASAAASPATNSRSEAAPGKGAAAATAHPHPQRRLASGWPDVICLDSNMPAVGGAAAIRGLRAVADRLRAAGLADAADSLASTPILGITGDAHDRDRARFVRQGATQVLTKPVEPEALQEAVSALLGPRMPRRRR